MHPDVLIDGLRIALENFRKRGHAQYGGDADAICRQVIDACWNGTYLKAGAGHLDQFWVRDLGWCVDDLLRFGYGDRVEASLDFALARYVAADAVTTTIFRHRTPADVYTFATDSLPFLLYCLRKAKMEDRIHRHREFFQRQIHLYVRTAVDELTGMVRKDRYFSTCKDVMRYASTCTSNCFLHLLRQEIAKHEGLRDPLGQDPASRDKLAADIVRVYWREDHFINDDVSKKPFMSADANVWPFWCGVVDSTDMLRRAVQAVGEAGLDSPFPIRYHRSLDRKAVYPLARAFIPNYQGDSIWTLLGPLWIGLVAKVDLAKARRQLDRYTEMIEQYGTFVEVFEPDGRSPLRGRFGHGSAFGMLWAVMYLGRKADLSEASGDASPSTLKEDTDHER